MNTREFLSFLGLVLFVWIIIILAMVIFVQNDCKAQDSTTVIPIGNKGCKLYWLNLPVGTSIRASGEPDTQLEAVPFIGAGSSLVFRQIEPGIALSIFFYTEGEKIYPVAFLGITLFNNRFVFGPAWNAGRSPENGSLEGWQRRLQLMLSYNLSSLPAGE